MFSIRFVFEGVGVGVLLLVRGGGRCVWFGGYYGGGGSYVVVDERVILVVGGLEILFIGCLYLFFVVGRVIFY